MAQDTNWENGSFSAPEAVGDMDWESGEFAPPPPKRSLAAVANDTVIEFANAAAGGASAAANFVKPGNAASKWIDKNIVQAGESKQSDVVKAEKAQLSSGLADADGMGDEAAAVGRYIVNNPLLSAAQAAGSFVGPGFAVKGVGLAARAAGAGAQTATRAGRAGGVAAGVALSGGDAAGTAYDLASKAGATEDQAVSAGRQASVIPAIVGGVTGAFGAEKLLAGAKGFTGGMAARALKTGASEALQEGVEEGVTQYEGQRAAVPYDPSINPMKGVAGAATMGAALGGITGAGVGALDGVQHGAQQRSDAQAAQAAEDPAQAPAGAAPVDAAPPAMESATAQPDAPPGAPDQNEPGAPLPTSDPVTPEQRIAAAEEKLAFVQQQAQANGWDKRLIGARDEAMAELDALRPAPEASAATLAIDQRPLSQQMGIDPTAGPLSKAAATAVDSGTSQHLQDAQFIGATGRDLQVRATGPGVTDNSNVIDVQGRVVDELAVGAARGINVGAQRALPPPKNLREGLERIRAQRQEAANAQAATQSAPTSALAVSTARPGAVEAAGPAPVSTTTGVTDGPQADQAQQTAPQQPQAPADPGLTNAATTQNDGAQGQAATGPQGAAQAAQAGVAPRPKNWRTSMLGATPVAKAMGIDTKGKRLAQVVAEIDARDTRPPAAPIPAPTPTPDPVRIGRDQTPLAEGGKPFKTRKAAADAKKLQPMMRVVPVDGGYALAEKTPAQLVAEAKAARRLAQPRTGTAGAPLAAHEFIAAEGGLNAIAASDLGIDGNPRIGNRRLFAGRGRGLSMEQATQKLIADGYLGEGATLNDAYALIKTSLSRPQYSADGYERIAQAESDAQFDDYMAAQEEMAQDDDGFDGPFGLPPELTAEDLAAEGYTAANPALQAEVNALVAQAEAAGIDTYDVLEDIARNYADATQDQYNAAAREALAAAIARSNQDGGRPTAATAPAAPRSEQEQGLNQPVALEKQAQAATESVAPEALELAAQTPAEAAARQDAQEQAAKAEAAAKRAEDAAAKAEEERKRIAQASVRAADRFELGQDPMDSLTGQGSVFDAQEPAKRDGPQIPSTGKILAQETMKLEPTKRQDATPYARYATGEYIVTVEDAGSGPSTHLYSVMRSRGVTSIERAPNEMLEHAAFDKIGGKARALFDAIGAERGQGAMFSRAPSAAAPTADSNARNVATQMLVDGLTEKWTRAPEIIVARNMQDPQVPQAVRDYDETLKSQGATGEARGFIYKGKVYLLSDELKGQQQIAEVLFHEVLGHYGLRGAFGDSLDTILQQIGTMRRRDVVAKAREYGLFDKDALGGMDKKTASVAQIWAAMSSKDRLSAAEEVLAEMAQTQPNIGFVQRAIAAIRNWLRSNVPGFKSLRLTDADIIQAYILPARGFVTRSKETGAQSLERAMMAFSRVWHGSPHKFLQFDSSKIGTGEGAQAYGHGLYLAEHPETAMTYQPRDKLMEAAIMRKYSAAERGQQYPAMQVYEDFLLHKTPQEVADNIAQAGYSAQDLKLANAAHKIASEQYFKQRAGSLYQVDLPDEHIAKMLDWDKPLKEQSEEVQKALNKLGVKIGETAQEIADRMQAYGMSASDALEYGMNNAYTNTGALAYAELGRGADASEKLRQAGIPGIRYLDSSSRGNGAGTSNYVIFPGMEKILTIIDVNGEPVTGAEKAKVLGEQMDMAFSRAPQSRSAAIKEMLDAQAAWDKMKKGDAENITLEKFSEMTDRSINARTALADELVSMPDDGFALQAKTSDGRMLILTPSAQKAGKWQLTRFGSDGTPWGDTNFDTKKQAALEFIDEADLKTIQGADNEGAAFSRGTNEAMTNNDVVGNQGGRSADDSTPGVVYEDSMPAEREGSLRLYHAGTDPTKGGYFSEVPSGGVFDGMFALAGGWGNYGTGAQYFADIPREKVLTQRELDYELDYETVKSALAESFSFEESDLETVWSAVVEDKSQSVDADDLQRIFREDSIGEASWEAQRIRGKVASALGYQAVEMDDENGTSYLIVAGTPLTRVLSANESTAPDSGGAAFSRTATDQTQTAAFKKWFGDSKVVDADGKPLVVYHGTGSDFDVFDESAPAAHWKMDGFYFAQKPADASRFAESSAKIKQNRLGNAFRPDGANVMPVYLSLQNPKVIEFSRRGQGGFVAADEMREILAEAKFDGHDGAIIKGWQDGSGEVQYVAFRPEQIKSATGNNGNFDPADPDIRFSRTSTATGTQSAWDAPVQTGFDDVIYKLQDKNIDLKRVVEAITKSAGQVADSVNAYLKEELFHKRAAKRVEDFGARELKPLMNQMRLMGLGMEDVEEYLHARHAKEANAVIAQRNPGEPGLQDGGSGMTDQAADSYFAKLDPVQRRKLEAVAKNVDAIIDKTRKLYVSYGLENQDVVDGWASMYQHYIPLMREDKDGGMGTGQGFSVKGKETKGRTGSTRKVVDILANIASQREKLIVRGEKNIVAQALVGLAQANPNPDFWEVRSQAPTERVFDPKTGVVVDRPDPLFKSRENVAVAKVKDANGKVTEQMVVFNEDNPRAVRMAAAMKNLDAGNLEGLLGMSAKITRYFSAINTQYNPVFGVVNLVRDVQGAMVNLAATPLAGQQGKIARDTVSALAGIYGDIRKTRKGGQASSKWAQLWEQMQEDGGTTGYRELFTTSADRANNLKSILNPEGWMDNKWGKFFTADGRLKVPMSVAQKGATEIFGWLSDYNEAMENGVRLAAYKAALDKGMSREQAASLAKNLTVNFNRKGQVGMQAGAVYAFFNAAMQGTARIGQTLFDMDGGDISTLRLSKTGKAVVYGGVTLGVMQALALAGAGFDEEDPPEFVRERSLIIPTGGKTYVSIPMPLGLHVIPGIGRHATEFALSGFDKPAKRALSVIGMFADAFNPIGNAGLSMQTLAPTALDPLVALTENKDWTGKPIARVSFNKAMPGHTQWKDTATWYSKMAAEAINWVSGGNEYVAGALSPTPDQIDYLIAQVGGGVAREASKVFQAASTTVNGEELPTYKIPLLGRFAGNAASQASQGTAFYANLDRLNALETEIKGLRKDGRFGEAAQLARENPQAIMIPMANRAERDVQKLRREKRELIATGANREEVRAKEAQITAVMARLNEAAARRKATAPE